MSSKFLTSFAATMLLATSTLTGCALETDTADLDEDVAQGEEALRALPFTQFRFGAPSGRGERTVNNADFYQLGAWIVPSPSSRPLDGSMMSDLRDIARTKTPYLYFYIAASMAKNAWSLHDCNVPGVPPSSTLCHRGAEYIRSHKSEIINKHREAAAQVQSAVGPHDRQALIHVEPDWYQYTEARQNPLSFEESGEIMNQIIRGIKSSCRNCTVVMDVSFWGARLREYFRKIDMTQVGFIGVTGGHFSPTREWIDRYRFVDMTAITGKKLIVGNSAGTPTGGPSYDTDWEDAENLKAMWNSGVVAVIQPNRDVRRYQSAIERFHENPIRNGNRGWQPGWSFKTTAVQEWWKQLKVGAPNGVRVREVFAEVDGARTRLSFDQRLGEWTGNAHVPPGHRVRFLAVDARGRRAYSRAFTP